MKYIGISGGRIIEGFSITPNININWMYNKNQKRIYDLQFSWFFWYFTIGEIKKYLKSMGY